MIKSLYDNICYISYFYLKIAANKQRKVFYRCRKKKTVMFLQNGVLPCYFFTAFGCGDEIKTSPEPEIYGSFG